MLAACAHDPNPNPAFTCWLALALSLELMSRRDICVQGPSVGGRATLLHAVQGSTSLLSLTTTLCIGLLVTEVTVPEAAAAATAAPLARGSLLGTAQQRPGSLLAHGHPSCGGLADGPAGPMQPQQCMAGESAALHRGCLMVLTFASCFEYSCPSPMLVCTVAPSSCACLQWS
jgi:hypothetical protein